MVSLQTIAPNVNNIPLPNHWGFTINTIETDDNWFMAKAIILIVHNELEKVLASLIIREKKEFVILTLENVVTLVTIETNALQRFVIETASAQGITRSGRCYTPEELGYRGQKKNRMKSLINEAEVEEFWRKFSQMTNQVLESREDNN